MEEDDDTAPLDQRRSDWDAEDDAELDEEDAKLSRRVVEHYQSLLPDDLGSGFFQRGLESFHQGPDLPGDAAFFTTPRSLLTIHRYDETPAKHPLRSIAWILNEAAENTTIRVFCYRLTDIVAIELLVHAGSKCEVQVILCPDAANERGLNDFVDAVGPIGRNAILENMEIRLANLSGSHCESRKVAMHHKSIITDRYAAVGSYNLSTFARVGNWEELFVVPTVQRHKDRFDELWDQLYTRPMESFYQRFRGPNIPLGPKRTRRQGERELLLLQARNRQESRLQRELENARTID